MLAGKHIWKLDNKVSPACDSHFRPFPFRNESRLAPLKKRAAHNTYDYIGLTLDSGLFEVIQVAVVKRIVFDNHS
jgi:hypothetical protein